MVDELPSEGLGDAVAGGVALPPTVAKSAVPTAVWLVIALEVAAGGFLTIWALVELPNAFNLFGNDPLGTWFSLVVLMLVLIVGAMGLGILYLAVLLYRADRVGRGVTYVACASVAASILFGSDHSTGFTLAALGCILAVAALALLPDVQAFFTGPGVPGHDRPSGVVIAQSLIVIWVFIIAIVGVVYLMLSFAGASAKYGVIGAILVAIAFGAKRINAQLASGDASARNIASLGAIAVVLLDLIAGNATGTGFFLPLGWSIGILAYLWLPQECQAFFAPAPAVAATAIAATPASPGAPVNPDITSLVSAGPAPARPDTAPPAGPDAEE